MKGGIVMAISHEKKNSFAQFEVFGISLPVFLIFAAIVAWGTYFQALSTNDLGNIALLLALGYAFGVVGDRIPIWKDYIGGGGVLAFLGTAAMVYWKVLPDKYVKSVTAFMDSPEGFLDMFVSVLVVGSIISINRKTLLKSLLGYIPAILASIAAALLFGVTAGLVTGVSPSRIMLMYVLPIMGGGNGAGAVPLSQMWQQITGGSRQEYYSVATAILTVANIIAIFSGSLLNKLGEKRPSLTGNGELMRDASTIHHQDDYQYKPSSLDVIGGLFMITVFFELAMILAKQILPNIGNIPIHQYVYLILIVTVANCFDLVPVNLREGAKAVQKFFSDHVIWILMAGVGIAYTDLGALIGVLTLSNLFIAFAIVLGAMVGPFFFSYLVGFYPIEAAITAGLCMANRGGSGDIMVLGAAKRMQLMPYSQISSRMGGGIVLVIGSILFGVLGK